MRTQLNRFVLTFFLCAAASLLPIGCDDDNRPPPAPVDHPSKPQLDRPDQSADAQTQPTPPPTMGDIKEQASQTMDTTKAYLDHKKDEIVKQTQLELDQLGRRIDELRQGVEAKGQDALAKWTEIKADLDTKLHTAKEKAKQYKDASAEAAGELGQGVSDAITQLEAAFHRAQSHFKSPSSPETQSTEDDAEPQK